MYRRTPRSHDRRDTRAARTLASRTIAVLALGVLAVGAPSTLAAQDDATVVYLVRHAERAEDGTNDPMISAEGQVRADQVAELLRDAGITHVHTTDFRRTRATGQPAADMLGLEMSLYDPRDLPGFAESLRSTPGRHLVLGHSNTTPDLVALRCAALATLAIACSTKCACKPASSPRCSCASLWCIGGRTSF